MQQANEEFLKAGVGLRFVARGWRVPSLPLKDMSKENLSVLSTCLERREHLLQVSKLN